MPDQSKPPYRVPSMTEVAAIRGTNGYTAISTFSGAGGSCLGHEMAGFHLTWANEFVPAAQEVFRLNHPDTHLDTRDIRDVKAADILRAIGLSVGELDLFDGSPPCSSFSTAGKRDKGWGAVKKYSDTAQRTDDLFYEYARLVGDLQPRVFVAENVSGLVKGTAKGYFQLIMRELKSKGYRVKAKLLDAKWLGVPQSRERLIFMGVRNDLELDPVYPTPLSYFYSVRDALPWLDGDLREANLDEQRLPIANNPGQQSQRVDPSKPSPAIVVASNGNNARVYAPTAAELAEQRRPITHRPDWSSRVRVDNERPAPTITVADHGNSAMVYGPTAAELAEASSEGYAIADEWAKTPKGQSSDRFFNLARAHEDRPSPCVTASGGGTSTASVMHPNEPRKFTISELKRICAFPDDFQLTGSYSQQWERLGRAVPPLMMRAVAETVRDQILAKVSR